MCIKSHVNLLITFVSLMSLKYRALDNIHTCCQIELWNLNLIF